MQTFTKEDLQSSNDCVHRNRPPRRKVSKLEQFLRKPYAGLVCCVVGFTVVLGVLACSGSSMYAIKLDGEEIAVLANRHDAENALKEYASTALGDASGVSFSDKVKILPVKDKDKKDVVTVGQAVAALDGHKEAIQVEGVAIVIDGETKVYMASKEMADKAIQEAKKYYIKDDKNAKVLDAKFREDVSVVACSFTADKNSDLDGALNLLVSGQEKQITHTVEKGESLSVIAQKYGITTAQLQAYNPDVNPTRMRIGSVLNVSKYEPLLNVVVVSEVAQTNKLPYATEYVNNSEMLRGEQKVVQAGKTGQEDVVLKIVTQNGKEITRERVSTVVVSEPEKQVVERGTKVVVASRGSGGSGILGWPVTKNRINSPFGYRGRELHTGIDIQASKGQRVSAAESGKVISAGWKGNYGNCVMIDHGDGLVTLYAHMNSVSVSTGSTVAKGDKIGEVGSTGRSTGPHMHFEVRVNGKQYNPLNYLS